MSARAPELSDRTRVPLGWVIGIIAGSAGLLAFTIDRLDRADSKYLRADVAEARFAEVRSLVDTNNKLIEIKIQTLTDEVKALNPRR